MSDAPALSALLEKWRKWSKDVRLSDGSRVAYSRCADELEAALTAVPSAPVLPPSESSWEYAARVMATDPLLRKDITQLLAEAYEAGNLAQAVSSDPEKAEDVLTVARCILTGVYPDNKITPSIRVMARDYIRLREKEARPLPSERPEKETK